MFDNRARRHGTQGFGSFLTHSQSPSQQLHYDNYIHTSNNSNNIKRSLKISYSVELRCGSNHVDVDEGWKYRRSSRSIQYSLVYCLVLGSME